MTTQATTPGTPPAGQPGAAAPAAAPAAPTGTPTDGTPAAAPATPAAPAAATPAAATATTPGENGQGQQADPAQKPGTEAGEVEVTLAEGVEATPEQVAQFKEFTKDWGLNSEQASKVASHFFGQIQEQEKTFVELNASWESELASDPEIGGENLEQNKVLMRRVVSEIGGEQLVKDIEQYRLGNLPSLARFVWKCRSLVQEGNSAMKPGAPGATSDADAQLRRDYPSMFNEDGTPKQL